MLYDAFQAEAAKRTGRTVAQWQDAEERAVWAVARDYAEQFDLVAPTMDDVKRASTYASGSIDYGAKWAYAIEKLMVPLESMEIER
jgi:hypothetical protein